MVSPLLLKCRKSAARAGAGVDPYFTEHTTPPQKKRNIEKNYRHVVPHRPERPPQVRGAKLPQVRQVPARAVPQGSAG